MTQATVNPELLKLAISVMEARDISERLRSNGDMSYWHPDFEDMQDELNEMFGSVNEIIGRHFGKNLEDMARGRTK